MEDMGNYGYTLFRTIPFFKCVLPINLHGSLFVCLDLSQFFVPFCAFHGLFGSYLFRKVLSLHRKNKDNK